MATDRKNPTFEEAPLKEAPHPALGDERKMGLGTNYPKVGNDAQMGNGTQYPLDGNFVSKGSPASAYPKVGNELPHSTDTGKYRKG